MAICAQYNKTRNEPRDKLALQYLHMWPQLVRLYMVKEFIRAQRKAYKKLSKLSLSRGLENRQRLWAEVSMHQEAMLAEAFTIGKKWQKITPSTPHRDMSWVEKRRK